MAKYRIPRDTDVEGDLRVYGNVTDGNGHSIEADMKSVAIDQPSTIFEPLIEILVNSDVSPDILIPRIVSGFTPDQKVDIHVPTGIDKLTINIDDTPSSGNPAIVFITNASGSTTSGGIETYLEVEFVVTSGDRVMSYDAAALTPAQGTRIDIIPGSSQETTVTAANPLTSIFRIDRRNSTRFEEIVRTSGGSTEYRPNEDIDADVVPITAITNVLNPSNDPAANVQEALAGIQDNIDAVTVGTLNITADDVSITPIDGITTPNNNAQEALASLQSNINDIGPWVPKVWTVGEKTIWDGAIYLLGVTDKDANDTDDPATDTDWSELIATPGDLNVGASTAYVLNYTTTQADVLADVTLRRSNVLHALVQEEEFLNGNGQPAIVYINRNDHVELRFRETPGDPLSSIIDSELYIATAHSLSPIPAGTIDFATILDDTGNFLKVQVDEDTGHVEAGLLSVDTTSPTSTANLGLFYGTDTTGTADVDIDFSELENEIIANDTRLDRLDGNFHGSGLEQITDMDAVSITYGFGNAVLITVDGIVPNTTVDVGEFIGLVDGTALTELDDPSLLDFKLKVTAVDDISGNTRYTASIISGQGALSTPVFVYRFVDDPADGDIVVVNPSRELRNVNATDGSVSVSGNIISAGVHSGIVNAVDQEIELFYGTDTTVTADVDVDISAIATPAFSLDALINSIHQENAEEYEGGSDFTTIRESLVDPHAEDFYNSLGLFLVFRGSLTDINTLIPDGTHYYLFDFNGNEDEVFTTTIPRVVLRATNYRNHLGGSPAVTQVKFSVIRGLNNIFDSDYTGGTRTLDNNDPIHDYLWRGDKADTTTRSRHTLQEKVDGDLVLTEKPIAATTENDDDDGTLTTKGYVDFKVITYADIVNGAGKIESSGEVSGNQFIEYSHPGSPGVNFFRIFLTGEEEIRRDSSTGDIILTREY